MALSGICETSPYSQKRLLFEPIPNVEVSGHCSWTMRLNTDYNRIPPVITEILCTNPGAFCNGNTFFCVSLNIAKIYKMLLYQNKLTKVSLI